MPQLFVTYSETVQVGPDTFAERAFTRTIDEKTTVLDLLWFSYECQKKIDPKRKAPEDLDSLHFTSDPKGNP